MVPLLSPFFLFHFTQSTACEGSSAAFSDIPQVGVHAF